MKTISEKKSLLHDWINNIDDEFALDDLINLYLNANDDEIEQYFCEDCQNCLPNEEDHFNKLPKCQITGLEIYFDNDICDDFEFKSNRC